MWQNLYDFYLIETEFDTPVSVSTDDLLTTLSPLPESVYTLVQLGSLAAAPVEAVQLLSHQRIHARFYVIDLPTTSRQDLPVGLNWFNSDEINHLPKPVIITNYLVNPFG